MRNFYVMLLFAVVFTLNQCKPEADACKNVTCLNGGTCIEGNCKCATGFKGAKCDSMICDAGYEGKTCDVEIREKFTGSFSTNENGTETGNSLHSVNINKSANILEVKISNMWAAFNNTTTAIIDKNKITIPDQEPDNDGYRVWGSGTINASGSTISVLYYVTDGPLTDTVTGTWSKQ